jgi:hypothetical protein
VGGDEGIDGGGVAAQAGGEVAREHGAGDGAAAGHWREDALCDVVANQ